jgi:hypothetical protein
MKKIEIELNALYSWYDYGEVVVLEVPEDASPDEIERLSGRAVAHFALRIVEVAWLEYDFDDLMLVEWNLVVFLGDADPNSPVDLRFRRDEEGNLTLDGDHYERTYGDAERNSPAELRVRRDEKAWPTHDEYLREYNSVEHEVNRREEGF